MRPPERFTWKGLAQSWFSIPLDLYEIYPTSWSWPLGPLWTKPSHADLILHVIDACSPVAREQKAEVEAVLEEIGVDDIPRIEVMNKIDQMPQTFTCGAALERDNQGFPSQVFLSAKMGLGLDLLRSALAECSQMTDRMRVEHNRAKKLLAPDEFLEPLPERPDTSEFNPISNRSYFSNDA